MDNTPCDPAFLTRIMGWIGLPTRSKSICNLMSRHLRGSVPWQEALRGAGNGRGAAVFGAMRLAPYSEFRQVAANLFVAFALAGTSRSPTPLPSMKIRSHSESHLVE